MPRLIDLTGKRFSRLTVTSLDYIHKTQGAHWLCLCDCGEKVVVSRANLLTGNSKSCGCLKDELFAARIVTHGETIGNKRSPEYYIWASMLRRCNNEADDAYRNYGERGIKVCEEWHSFENFIRDMGRKPSREHSIDRIDNDLGYSKGNCRWATPPEQSRNTRRNRIIQTPDGPMLLCDAAERAGMPISVLWKRLKRGWATKDLFKPLGTYTRTRQGAPIEE